MAGRRTRAAALLWLVALAPACERGCASAWLRGVTRRSLGSAGSAETTGVGGLGAVDCPDGLARCAEGTVESSRLASIPQPCRGPESACACPWEPVGQCPHGCVVDGLEVVMGRGEATAQLCVLPPGEAVAEPTPPGAVAGPVGCDEGELYRCERGGVVDCTRHAVVASCLRGCVTGSDGIRAPEGEHSVAREEAFAILCSH